MDHLIALALLGKPDHRQFSNADAEARYYAAMDPGNRRWIALPIASLMVVVAVVLVGVLPW